MSKRKRFVSEPASLYLNYRSLENSTTIPANTYTGTFLYCSQYSTILAIQLSNVAGTLHIDYSFDGSTTATTTSLPTLAATPFSTKQPLAYPYVRSRWVKTAAAPASLLLTTTFSKQQTYHMGDITLTDATGSTGVSIIEDSTAPTFSLRKIKSTDASVTVTNTGTGEVNLVTAVVSIADAAGSTGVSLLEDSSAPTFSLRKIKSTDASVTVTNTGTGEVNLAVTPAVPIVIQAANNTSTITEAPAGTWTIKPGTIAGAAAPGSMALNGVGVADVDEERATLFGYQAGAALTNTFGTLGNYTLIGYNAGKAETSANTKGDIVTIGAYCADTVQDSMASVYIGVYNTTQLPDGATAYTTIGRDNCIVGTYAFNAGTCTAAVTGNTFLGTEAGYGADTPVHNTFIGRRAGLNAASTATYCTFLGGSAGSGCTVTRAVCIGRACAAPAVAGRLCFGDTMEAVHGSFAVPAANPQAYIKIAWNGTLYYIPAYTTVPA